jgi:hypothetical protein
MLEGTPVHHQNVNKCLGDLKRLLVLASDNKILTNGKFDILGGVKTSSAPENIAKGGAVSIIGGEKNFARDPAKRHFSRQDGAWFDFVLTIRDSGKGVVLIAYNFEIRFPESWGSPSFIRFDLNPPDHPNEEHGVRSHVHPGTDDYSIPSAVLDPTEILDLFLFGLVPRLAGC